MWVYVGVGVGVGACVRVGGCSLVSLLLARVFRPKSCRVSLRSFLLCFFFCVFVEVIKKVRRRDNEFFAVCKYFCTIE